jgi:hypothetical protein
MAFVPLLVLAPVSLTAEPLTKEQLLTLVKEGVDAKVITALVKKDCVSFTVDANATLELSKKIPAEVLAAAIDCQRIRTPPPSPPIAAPVAPPAPTSAPGPRIPARIRVSASSDASDESGYSQGAPERCMLVVDYAGTVTVLKGGEGYAPHPSFRDEFPGVKVHEMPVARAWDKAPKTWVDVSPGPHTVSLFCRKAWTKTDVKVEVESGVDYRILLRFGFGDRLQVVGVEPDR